LLNSITIFLATTVTFHANEIMLPNAARVGFVNECRRADRNCMWFEIYIVRILYKTK